MLFRSFPLRIWTQGSATTPYGLAVTRSGQSLQYIHIHEADGSKHVIETAAISAKAFYIRNNQAESLIFGTNGSDRVNINSSGNVLINGFGSSTPGLTIKGASSQSASLQQWQNSTGTSVAYMDAGGGLTASYLSINGYISGTRASVIPNSSSEVGIIIKGVASQTADLQQWQISDGTVGFKIASDGTVYVTNNRALFANSGYIGSTSFASQAAGPTWSAIIAKGAASQTANLQEWQNSAGTVLTSVQKSGSILIDPSGDGGTFIIQPSWGGVSEYHLLKYRPPTGAYNIAAIKAGVVAGGNGTFSITQLLIYGVNNSIIIHPIIIHIYTSVGRCTNG